MLDIIYSFIFQPIKTIQLKSHTKTWVAWCFIILITSLISCIKLSAISVLGMISHGIIISFGFLCLAIIIDMSAQLMGAEGQLKNLIYWIPFVYMIFWLVPSISMIQESSYMAGSILFFILNVVFIIIFGKSLGVIYGFDIKRIIGLFIIPIVASIGIIISLMIYGIQLVGIFA